MQQLRDQGAWWLVVGCEHEDRAFEVVGVVVGVCFDIC